MVPVQDEDLDLVSVAVGIVVLNLDDGLDMSYQ